ncbi:MAG: Glu/Leu/Phe/Val dehydrogenase [Gemmatimonadota bacterium]
MVDEPELFDMIGKRGHEQVLFTREPTSGYMGIIAIHNTSLGPALGGTRFWNYESDRDALVDVLRLSRGMTYKAAVAGLNLGGGKAVIIGDNKMVQRELIMRAHGRAVETLGGRYITAEDVGTTVEDMDFVHMETDHVVGMAGKSGDPSPVTAYGTYRGIQASAARRYGSDDLSGRSVMVQGAGNVGYSLCGLLSADGAKVFVSDIDAAKVGRVVTDFGATETAPDEVYEADVDIFAPCALGAVLNDDTIPKLRVQIVAGAANNQLSRLEHAQQLKDAGILYAPDYVINAGGLINVYSELAGWSLDRSKRKAGEIYNTMLQIFELADERGITNAEAADQVAMLRVEHVATLHSSWV